MYSATRSIARSRLRKEALLPEIPVFVEISSFSASACEMADVAAEFAMQVGQMGIKAVCWDFDSSIIALHTHFASYSDWEFLQVRLIGSTHVLSPPASRAKAVARALSTRSSAVSE